MIFGLTLGTGGAGDPGHFDLLLRAGMREAAFAITGGFIWNIGNILLLYALGVGAMAIAYTQQ